MNNPNHAQPKALRITVIVLAIIGGISLLSAAGMAVMHSSMMAGTGC